MQVRTQRKVLVGILLLGLPFALSGLVFAEAAGVGQVESFIRNIIQVLAGLAGLVATGFFVNGSIYELCRA